MNIHINKKKSKGALFYSHSHNGCPEPQRILSLSIIPMGKVVSMPLMPCENIDLLSFAVYQK